MKKDKTNLYIIIAALISISTSLIKEFIVKDNLYAYLSLTIITIIAMIYIIINQIVKIKRKLNSRKQQDNYKITKFIDDIVLSILILIVIYGLAMDVLYLLIS